MITTYQIVMIWLDANAFLFVAIDALFGWKAVRSIPHSLVDRLKRGVYGR